MEIEHELYCIKKIIPSELELRGYLNQCCQYTGKRSYLEESEMIVDYIESKGFELKDISKIPFNEIIQIMNHCKIFPAFLYFSTSDQFAKYDSPDFGITIENAIMDRYEGIFLDQDCTIPALPNPAEKDELIEFLPKFYNSLQEVKLNYGKILIAYTLGGELLDIFTENGNKLTLNDVDAWRESDYIISCKIALDKKSILLQFLSRMKTWAVFECVNNSLLYKKVDSGFFDDNSYRNYYLPEEIDVVIEKKS